MRWGSAVSSLPNRDSAPEDTGLELGDVPAAVVCAVCGQPDCAGCLDLEEPTNASGVLAIVPWERPGMPLVKRWWLTAHLATLNFRTFFSALPDGPVAPALGFAVLSEVVAVTGLFVACLFLALPFAPMLPRLMLSDPVVRGWLVASALWGIPGLSTLMVALHALHGLMTDWAAKREGSRRRGRGLRFGLYGCGWDVITLPAGLTALGISEGFGAMVQALPLGLTAPAQAVRSYLTGVHGLAPEPARRAARYAAGASVAIGVASLAVLTAAILLLRR